MTALILKQNFEQLIIDIICCGFVEPDVGMPQYQAQKYFKQLIAGVVSELHCFMGI